MLRVLGRRAALPALRRVQPSLPVFAYAPRSARWASGPQDADNEASRGPGSGSSSPPSAFGDAAGAGAEARRLAAARGQAGVEAAGPREVAAEAGGEAEAETRSGDAPTPEAATSEVGGGGGDGGARGPYPGWLPTTPFEDEVEESEYEVARVGFGRLRESGFPPSAAVGSGPTWLDGLLDATLYAALRPGVELAISEGIERSFSAEEFLEGSKDAFWMVSKLIGEGETDLLEPMVSPGILTAVRREARVAARCGVRVANDPPADIDARIVGMQLWDETQYRRARGEVPEPANGPGQVTDLVGGWKSPAGGDGADAGAPASGSGRPAAPSKAPAFAASVETFAALAAGRYLALAVRFDSSRAVRVLDTTPPSSDEGAAEGGQDGQARTDPAEAELAEAKPARDEPLKSTKAEPAAQSAAPPPPPPPQERVLARFTNRRPARWVFARGPLPEGLPVRELYLPWTLVEAI